MTAPSGDPASGTPAPAPAPAPAPGVPAPAPQPTAPAGQDPHAPIDFNALPPNVSAYIAQLRNEAGGHRQAKTAAETAAAEAKTRLEAVLKAAGLNPDGSTAPPDPEKLAAQLRQQAIDADERAQAAEDARWGSEVKLQIHRLAGKCGADAEALLDSNAFVDSLDEIADDEPSAAGFSEALSKKIIAAVAANPNLAAKRTGPTRMGADITGSAGGNTGRPRSLREAFSRKGT